MADDTAPAPDQQGGETVPMADYGEGSCFSCAGRVKLMIDPEGDSSHYRCDHCGDVEQVVVRTDHGHWLQGFLTRRESVALSAVVEQEEIPF